MASRSTWPMPMEMGSGATEERRETSPGQNSQHHHQHFPQAAHHNSPTLLTDWPMTQQPPQLPQYIQETPLVGTQFNPFGAHFQTSPIEYHLPATLPSTQAAFEAGLQMEAPFNGLAHSVEQQAAMWANWQEIENSIGFPGANDGITSIGRQSLGSNSPTGTYLEVLSLPSSSSDNGWATVDTFSNIDPYQQAQNAAIFNPGQTLHLRTHSDSSQSDGTGHTLETFGSFEDISAYPPYSPYSPDSDNYVDNSSHRNCYHGENHQHSHEIVSPTALAAPVPIKASPSSRTTPSSISSPPARRNSAPRKSPAAKSTKPVIRRISNGKKDTEKRVGRRRGPLLPEQRKQASEIRKLRACLRCKFLKKTCDKGEPCAGCQPSHARLWQVPCTRIDIKDIGYFMKDWRADYERHVGRGVSVYNIKGFAQKEELIWITHGYGFVIPIMAREVYVSDDSCFQVDWVETADHDEPLEFDMRTERMSAGSEGVSNEALSEYLDKHLDGPFEKFVDEYFEGTPFITEILKTAHRYYIKEKLPVIRKALKLVLAYNLTLHVTMVEQRGDEHPMEGTIDDEDSKYKGKVVAPVMINFQIKCALADMWRELQKEILEELSSLYSSVYSGDRLKNWPTIFMLASILLAVWEEMQFDSHYRVPDTAAVNKFCTDMETTPVGVIVGLFHAISQKLPAFTEWETRKHGQLLNNNVAVCEAMTEMREHVTKHEDYLKTRPDAGFDRRDFDCLSNKFLSKLVIRAN
ncbi:hypothetical protein BJ875DRAFT_383813 [Amylocarpus encephaloides]|uniref:Zn(2)-C6 fungal-type domain-containing protein n=1 Tax=Amylocarpus encephaloides TaxID=45428 RepID=A0A9P8C2H3_9HELO|nr:hypothetical protein BJ875DRAFT_383813 [Amylocarpus encephaloides]